MIDDDKLFQHGQTIEDWVGQLVEEWSDDYDSNYRAKHEKFRRIYNGDFEPTDKSRKSERSRLVSPASQQAVESSVAEIEEASFGSGKIFEVEDDYMDKDAADIQYLRTKLHEDIARCKVRRDLGECLLNAAIDGTGIAEIVMDYYLEQKPSTRDAGGGMTAIGVEVQERLAVKLRPIQRRNFRIDPNATCIDDALGVAIEEFVPLHSVTQKQEEGVYYQVALTPAAPDSDILPDRQLGHYPTDNTLKLTRYYGLVPSALLKETEQREFADGDEFVDLTGSEEDDGQYVEAIVVIANDGILLKAERNPYMMKDRPVVAFQWDLNPGQFDGRGVVEKARNAQSALDSEIRARIDALAYTVHPMLAMDANAIPRGAKPQVKPGQTILTNGRPADVLQPFNFGSVDQITFSQAAEMERMVQQATGAVDSIGNGTQQGQGTASGISMSLSAVLKRHKRTLINFQDNMLVPAIQKIAWRYMQFDPDNYPIRDYKFCVKGSLGMVQREYDMMQVIQLLQTLPPESPIYPHLLKAVVDHSSVGNREELIAALDKAAQPTPEQQQAQQMEQQRAQQLHEAQLAVLQGQAQESMARANKYNEEAKWAETEARAALLRAAPLNRDDTVDDSKEFERRLAIADRAIETRKVDIKEAEARLKAELAKQQARG